MSAPCPGPRSRRTPREGPGAAILSQPAAALPLPSSPLPISGRSLLRVSATLGIDTKKKTIRRLGPEPNFLTADPDGHQCQKRLRPHSASAWLDIHPPRGITSQFGAPRHLHPSHGRPIRWCERAGTSPCLANHASCTVVSTYPADLGEQHGRDPQHHPGSPSRDPGRRPPGPGGRRRRDQAHGRHDPAPSASWPICPCASSPR